MRSIVETPFLMQHPLKIILIKKGVGYHYLLWTMGLRGFVMACAGICPSLAIRVVALLPPKVRKTRRRQP